jgi:XTP/dITP diphosphohydrolase
VTKLLVGTNNPGKVREYLEILAGLNLELTSLAEHGLTLEPAETGTTFTENAILKARAFAAASGLPTLADDSGLEVDVLNGEPGLFSARYGATGRGEDARRCQLVLTKLREVPWERRTARFRCVVALSHPNGALETSEGVLEGVIAYEPKGRLGFGYDPIFYVPDFDRHLAELTPEQKHQISHRGRAVRAAMPLIQRLLKD